jgi:hypothetical protein
VLDPLIEWLKGLVAAVLGWIRRAIAFVTYPFRWTYAFYRRSGWIIRGVIIVLLLPFVIGYGWFIWNALWIRGYDVDYPDKYDFAERSVSAGEQVAVEGGQETTRTCAHSYLVQVVADLIDFNVNQNAWMSSNPFYKSGFFFVLSWDRTWFLDNKAAFQRGVHQAVMRTAVELADQLGRVRGTSRADPNLNAAKGNVQFDRYTWYFNPFDLQPFGPTTPSPSYYRGAIERLHAFNESLAACEATFDARGDNLRAFLDRIANDIGSRSAEIKERSENYNSGWFDTRADDIFMFAKGELYAYYGLLKAAREDFANIVSARELSDIWDRMEEHLRLAIELDPFIISNGREDGWLMPTHLTTMGFYILRARSNLVEIRSVLDR